MNNDLGRAFQISQAVLTARNFADTMMGDTNTPDSVTVRYPVGTSGCYYTDTNATINITGQEPQDDYPESYASWDVLMHEYGHHIQYQLDIIISLGFQHSSGSNHVDNWGLRSGSRFAWSEAWPTVFALMAQQKYISILPNIDTVGDANYTSYNGTDYSIEDSEFYKGEGCEDSIMGVLWDLYDSTNETKDELSIEDQMLWNITTAEHTFNFSNFMELFYETYPDFGDEIAKNLTKYLMAPSSPVIENSGNISWNITPSLTWYAQGGSTVIPNNIFDIVIFDINKNALLTLENVSATIHTDSSGNTYYKYSLSTNEWRTITNYYDSATNCYSIPIYISVKGYARFVSSQTGDTFTTGPYYSEYRYIYLSCAHSFVCESIDSTKHYDVCINCDYNKNIEEHIWGSSSISGYAECNICGHLKKTGISGPFIPIIKDQIIIDPEEETE